MNFIIRFSITFLFFLLLSCNNSNKTYESQPKNDSIKKYLELATNDTLSFPDRSKYNKKAFSFLDTTKNDTLTRWYFYKILQNKSTVNDTTNILKTFNKYLIKARLANNTLSYARFYRLKAGFYKRKRVYDSAYFFYLKSEKLYKKTNDFYGLAELYLYKSFIQNNINDYLGSELSVKKALITFEKGKSFKKIYQCYNALGNIYHCLKDYDNAIFFHKKSLEIAVNKNLYNKVDDNLIGTSLNNIGNVYRELKDFKKAIYFFDLAKKNELLKKRDPELMGYINENLGYCYLKMNKLKNAEFLLKSSLNLLQKFKNDKESGIVCSYLSQIYESKKDSINARLYTDYSLKLTKKSKETYYYLTALSYAGHTNVEKAPYYLEEYHRLNDSIILAERKARNQFYKIQLDVDQIKKEKESAIKQKWTAIATIASLLIIVILLFIIYKQKGKQKELKFLQEQQKANEDIYQLMLNQQSKEEEARQNEKKRIALELHDNIMNKLAATRFNLFAISQKTDKETIDKALLNIAKIKDIEDEIRAITHSLSNEPHEETQSFGALLEKLIEEQNTIQSTKYRLEIEEAINWELITSKVKMNLYRILQEAIHNINKHAEATTASVSIILDERNICMAVQDNGKGYEESNIHDGIGLKNMRQRIKEVKGKITIQSTPNQGTNIFMAIPF